MQKTILITGSADGIGLEAVKMLLSHGHKVLLHGRSPKKVDDTANRLTDLSEAGRIESYVADLSCMGEVAALAKAVAERNAQLDVLINNAGILRAPETITQDGLDVRFAVNTIAPYLIIQ